MLKEINRYVEPLLKAEVSKLTDTHPAFVCKYGSAVMKVNNGYMWFIDCWRQNSREPEPNCISLIVGTKNLESNPELCTFDVCWGGDGPLLAETVDLMEKSIPWGEEAKKAISSGLPALIGNLTNCLAAWKEKYSNNA